MAFRPLEIRLPEHLIDGSMGAAPGSELGPPHALLRSGRKRSLAVWRLRAVPPPRGRVIPDKFGPSSVEASGIVVFFFQRRDHPRWSP
jgi:hypothetical protein